MGQAQRIAAVCVVGGLALVYVYIDVQVRILSLPGTIYFVAGK